MCLPIETGNSCHFILHLTGRNSRPRYGHINCRRYRPKARSEAIGDRWVEHGSLTERTKNEWAPRPGLPEPMKTGSEIWLAPTVRGHFVLHFTGRNRRAWSCCAKSSPTGICPISLEPHTEQTCQPSAKVVPLTRTMPCVVPHDHGRLYVIE